MSSIRNITASSAVPDDLAKRLGPSGVNEILLTLSGFNADDRLHPVITLCVYYGEDEWDGPRCLMDMLNIPEKMKNMISDYKMNLLEIRKSGNMVFNNRDVKNAFDLVRRIYNAEFSKIKELYNHIEMDPDVGIVVGSITKDQKIIKHALSMKEKGGQFNMCTALKKLQEQNYQEAQDCFAELLRAIRATGNKEDLDRAIDNPSNCGGLYAKYGVNNPKYIDVD